MVPPCHSNGGRQRELYLSKADSEAGTGCPTQGLVPQPCWQGSTATGRYEAGAAGKQQPASTDTAAGAQGAMPRAASPRCGMPQRALLPWSKDRAVCLDANMIYDSLHQHVQVGFGQESKYLIFLPQGLFSPFFQHQEFSISKVF